jgi:hypothetical protein
VRVRPSEHHAERRARAAYVTQRLEWAEIELAGERHEGAHLYACHRFQELLQLPLIRVRTSKEVAASLGLTLRLSSAQSLR